MLTMPPPAPALSLTPEQRAVLDRLARSTAARHRTVQQAQALLLASEGVANNEIARRVGVSANSVRSWRARFEEKGLADFGKIAPGRGRKPWVPAGTVAAVVYDTLHAVPDDGSTHWTTRTMAARHGIGKDTVARIWRDHNLKPWQTKRFKVSGDPRFEEKLVDVVGLYSNPPERAAVFSFDEKTQCQALDRTQPSLPMRPGRAGTMTHDYKRNGTTDLFAALNVATGEVISDCRRRHTAADVLRFFKLIDLHVPRHLDVHVVLDNLSAHKAPEVQKWLAHPKRSRWHLHFIPTSSSWLNLVERWFKELTDRRLRRGTFTSVPALIEAIETYVEHWNDDPKPFMWHKTAEEIITKVRRGRGALAQVKSATRD
jgi:transposase